MESFPRNPKSPSLINAEQTKQRGFYLCVGFGIETKVPKRELNSYLEGISRQ